MASIFRLASIFRYMHVVSEPAEECRRIRRRRELVVVVVMLVLNAGPKDLVVQLTIHSIVLNKLS